ncbi:MAG: hybrid sensor histidine kinase/response regulator [Blastocatellia bacterium]
MQPVPTEVAETSHRLSRALKLMLTVTSLSVALIGAVALARWSFGLESLKSLASNFLTTAFCFTLMCASLSLWWFSPKSSFKRHAAQFCGALVALTGLLTLSQYLAGWDLPTKRMLFNNAFCFMFSGFALTGVRTGTGRRNRVAQLFALTSGFCALTTIIGYLYGAPDLIGFFHFTRPAMYAAIALFALNVWLLATQEGGGMIASFVSHGPEGILARQLALGGGVALVALGLLTEWGERALYLQPQAQKALLITTGVAIISALVWRAMRATARLDVTRSRAEAALRQSEERYRAVSELTSDYVYEIRVATDGQMALEEATAAFTRITGFTPEEWREKGGLKSHIYPEDMPVSEQRLQRLLAGQEDVSEFRIITRGGETRWLRDYGRAVWDEAAGRVTRIYGAVEDITDRKLAEERLRESEARDITERKRAETERERLYERERAARAEAERMRAVAEAANRSKDEFLTMVSHELRSPLNAVLGYARLLRSGPTDGAFVAHAAAIVERNAKAQLQIVEDLLDSARIITGRLRLEARPADLVPAIEAAIAVARPAAESKGVELAAYFSLAPEQVLGDPDRLQQIVWNLLSNAVKFTPEGGRVELRMESDGEHVRITVSDNGAGIEPEFLPYVFDRFLQADTSVTRRFGGLGLGLSLVKQLTELHGGTISATSDGVGCGATFTVALPCLAMQPAIFAQPQPREAAISEVLTENAIPLDQAPSLDGSLILIVDDQEEARELMTLALKSCGAQVMAVSSGVEALAILSDPPGGVRPDALILDIAMPEEDGYVALQKVREMEAELGVEQSEQIPAIALTPYGRSEDRLRALAAGFRMHVAKPVEPLELAIVISSLIKPHRRSRQSSKP